MASFPHSVLRATQFTPPSKERRFGERQRRLPQPLRKVQMHILDLFPWTRPNGTHHHPKSAKSKPCFTTRNSTEYNTSAGCFATATTLPACSPKMKVPRIEVLMEEAIATSRFLRFRPGLVERICFKDSASCRGCLCQIQSNANQTCKVEKGLKKEEGWQPVIQPFLSGGKLHLGGAVHTSQL